MSDRRTHGRFNLRRARRPTTSSSTACFSSVSVPEVPRRVSASISRPRGALRRTDRVRSSETTARDPPAQVPRVRNNSTRCTRRSSVEAGRRAARVDTAPSVNSRTVATSFVPCCVIPSTKWRCAERSPRRGVVRTVRGVDSFTIDPPSPGRRRRLRRRIVAGTHSPPSSSPREAPPPPPNGPIRFSARRHRSILVRRNVAIDATRPKNRVSPPTSISPPISPPTLRRAASANPPSKNPTRTPPPSSRRQRAPPKPKPPPPKPTFSPVDSPSSPTSPPLRRSPPKPTPHLTNPTTFSFRVTVCIRSPFEPTTDRTAIPRARDARRRRLYVLPLARAAPRRASIIVIFNHARARTRQSIPSRRRRSVVSATSDHESVVVRSSTRRRVDPRAAASRPVERGRV